MVEFVLVMKIEGVIGYGDGVLTRKVDRSTRRISRVSWSFVDLLVWLAHRAELGLGVQWREANFVHYNIESFAISQKETLKSVDTTAPSSLCFFLSIDSRSLSPIFS